MSDFITLFTLILPIFIIIFIGLLLRIWKVVDDHFNKISNKIVFNVALPAFLFNQLARYDFNRTFDYQLVIYTLIGTVLFFFFAWFVSSIMKLKADEKGVFIQGSFRGNYAIIGLAVILNVSGEALLMKAAIVLAFALPLFNILSVIALTYPNKESENSYLKQILMNPLILAVLASIPFNVFHITLPEFTYKSIDYLSALTLPLALINIGASLHYESLRYPTSELVISSLLKLILQPFVFTLIAAFIGFNTDDLILIFVFFAVPTAIASYVMSDAMDRNSTLAGNIIVITTIASVITLPLGIYLIRIL